MLLCCVLRDGAMCLYWFLALSSTLVAEMIDGSIRCESEGVAHWDWPWIHCALFALLGDERRVFFSRIKASVKAE